MLSPCETVETTTCTAFEGGRRVATGPVVEVARALAAWPASGEPLLVFDDRTGAQLDQPLLEAIDAAAPAPSVGRPRLGVVAREVTLLPRHWEWLSQQRGGASAALRRLVDEARRVHAPEDRQRLARERAYRFISALAANWPGFEEASRALFAGDVAVFNERIEAWPADVREHLVRLADGAWADVPQPPQS